ncbi:protein Ecm18p [Monosporozyma servazzii]
MWSPSIPFKFTSSCKPTKVDAVLKLYQDEIMNSVQEECGSKVKITNDMIDDQINQWHLHNNIEAINSKQDMITTPTLLVHGYAASSMAYHRNFQTLSKSIKDLYAIDLPSNGLSSHISLPRIPSSSNLKYKIIKGDDSKSTATKLSVTQNWESIENQWEMVNYYEDYFIDSIERWRQWNHIEKFNLVGHSFGGYISSKYALKYPNHVNKLALLSPLGVERNVCSLHNVENGMNPLQKGDIIDLNDSDPTSPYYARSFTIPGFLFNNQLNVLRWMGPVGGKLARTFIDKRYSNIPNPTYREYLYRIFYKSNVPFGSANILALTHLFTREMNAKDPLLDNCKNLKPKDIMMAYGDEDWMNRQAGYSMTNILNKLGHNAQYVEVLNAGHNLFLDNPKSFDELLVNFLS